MLFPANLLKFDPLADMKPVRCWRYPTPSRDHTYTDNDPDYHEIGHAEGAFSDDRPFRAELWAVDQLTMVTFFFSTRDIENFDMDQTVKYLVSEHVVRYLPGRAQTLALEKLADEAGNELFSANIALFDDEDEFVEVHDSILFYPYGN